MFDPNLVKTRVPPSVSEQIQLLCQRIVPCSTPVYVPVSSIEGAELNECFPNVDLAVSRGGGQRLLGWKIMEWPDVLLDAEFHAVWIQPSGQLIDVSPEPLGWKRNLFLPDPTRKYDGKQVDNIRQALSPRPAIAQLIDLSERYFSETNKGDLAGFHGQMVLSPEATALLAQRAMLLAILKDQPVTDTQVAQLIVRFKLGRNERCPCGRGGKVKNCHGRDL